MYTKIKTKDGIRDIVSREFEFGTYYIINNNPSLQGGVNDKEEMFHKKVRIKAIKDENIILDGTILTCRSKYPINKFNS